MRTSQFSLAGLSALLVVAALACVAQAQTLLVRQDGSGNYTTITAAVNAAGAGYQIDIGPGTYFERVVLNKNLTLYSSAGAAATIIDGQYLYRTLSVEAGAVCSVQGLQFTHGSAGWSEGGQGGAVRVIQGSSLDVQECWFIENRSEHDAGAIWVYLTGARCTVAKSRFERNLAFFNGGACGVSTGAVLNIVDSSFIRNTAGSICGGVAGYEATLYMERCLLVGNIAQAVGAIRAYDCASMILNNTVYDNASPDRASVLFDYGGTCTFSYNVVCGDRDGFGAEFDGCAAVRNCNLYWDNAGGSVVDTGVLPSEREGDPLFCDWPGGDYQVCMTSPALPEVNGCGLIGAFGRGCDNCGPVGTTESSWGDVKTLYR